MRAHPSTSSSAPSASHLFGPFDAPHARYGTSEFSDAESFRFFIALTSNALDYARVFRGTCELPWPLACRSIHASTARELWIYRRIAPAAAVAPAKSEGDR